MNLPKPAERSREQGFTLIELLIVVAIIGILAAIAIPQFGKYRAGAAIGSLESDIRTCLSEAVAGYASGEFDTTFNCEDRGVVGEIAADSAIEITMADPGTPEMSTINITEYTGVSGLNVNCWIEEGRRVQCEEQ